MAVDPMYGVDDFNKPKVRSEMETYVNSVLLILLTEPGTYPSLPRFGMYIIKYLYQFEDEIDVDHIKAEMVFQCNEFLPEISSKDLDVYIGYYKDEPMLVFQMPMIDDSDDRVLVLGVKLNEHGELVYNFIEGNKTQMI